MNKEDIQKFLNEHDYDIRKTHNGRWIDQKCTMDVLCLISNCILEFVNEKNTIFTVKDIWFNDFTVENVLAIFKKPNPKNNALNEYDKYFGQPIKLLDAAHILKSEKKGSKYEYHINNKELLEYISINERNSLNFLFLYIEKVLKDSDIYNVFEDFFNKQNNSSFIKMRETFIEFIIKNTNINGSVECGRIFTKVLNPLAFVYNKRGTERGWLSKDIITQDKIIYNQKNWRDILSDKPKFITRDEHEASIQDKIVSCMTIYHEINAAKKKLRDFNNKYRGGRSEVVGDDSVLASQIHHIFPVNEFPTIASYIENLIALTPNQHYSEAHPNNNTRKIQKDFQLKCLIAKTDSIKENLLDSENQERIYNFQLFLKVLNIGLDTEEFSSIDENDFDELLNIIKSFFN